jgi:MFS family permease
VERRGPRVAATAAALFFGTGLLIGGAGLMLRQGVLVFLGMGIIGGIGCGLGYISPVSTLVKWFPDRRGMATGMAIMGFGGGAFIAGYLNVALMDRMGVASTVMALGAIYLVIMLGGSRLMRTPPAGWRPDGWTPSATSNPMIASSSVSRNAAIRTPQFYLLWGILCINVTAGIGILAQASPMMQDMFKRTPLEAAAGGVDHQPVQRRRTVHVGVGVRLHRAAQHLHHLLRRSDSCSFSSSRGWPRGGAGGRSRPACSWCSPCMAEVSPLFQPSWPIFSDPRTWAPSTARS